MPNMDFDKQRMAPFIKRLGNKDYLEVAGRVLAAHDARQYLGHDTELFETDTHYRFKCVARILNTHLVDFDDMPAEAKIGTFSGWSESVRKGGKSAEGTNPLEVAETSSVGRALGFAGFGILTSIASYEEVEAATERQGNQPTAAMKKTAFELAQKKLGVENQAGMAAIAQEKFGKPLADLTRDEVAAWIIEMGGPELAPF